MAVAHAASVKLILVQAFVSVKLNNLGLPGGIQVNGGIAESEREGTRAETRIGLSAKRTSPFKSAGGSVQSTTG